MSSNAPIESIKRMIRINQMKLLMAVTPKRLLCSSREMHCCTDWMWSIGVSLVSNYDLGVLAGFLRRLRSDHWHSLAVPAGSTS